MNVFHKIVFAGWSMSMSAMALADFIEIIPIRESGVSIKSVIAGGSGCVGGAVEVDEADPKALATLKFSQFAVDVRNGKRLDRKSCNLLIALSIPPGYEVGLPVAIARGWFYNQNASVQLRSEFFFRGGSTEPRSFEIRNGYQHFNVPVSLPAKEQAWSGCKTEVGLRMNLSLTARATTSSDASHVEFDEVKIISPELAGLKLRRCR